MSNSIHLWSGRGTYLEDDRISYIVTLLSMTVQEQDGLAAVLDCVNESYNGNVDRHEAALYSKRKRETCVSNVPARLGPDRANEQASPYKNQQIVILVCSIRKCQQFGRCYDVRGGLEAIAKTS